MKTFDQKTCPFCALACDDLSIKSDGNRLTVAEDLPEFCRSNYQKASTISITSPRYKGKNITHTEAIAKAATMLKQAKHPLFGGLITDIQGMRAVLPLARACDATLDHIDSNKTMRNLRVAQSCGVIEATLSEIRHHADLIVFVGEHIFDDYPRLAQRIYKTRTKKTKYNRKTVLVGPWQRQNIAEILRSNCDIIDTPSDKFPEFIQHLAMQFHKRFDQRHNQAAYDSIIATDTPHAALVDDIQRAEYPAIIWSSKDMDYPHADLSIASLAQLIKKINLRKRCVGLALKGNRGAGNMQSVCLWQSGYPGQLSFNSQQPYYNPLHNRSAELLQQESTDLLVWIASLHPEPPPASDLPTIAFVHPAIAEHVTSDLVIAVGIPGIDHTGYSYRTDGVIILPLPKLRDNTLPALHDLLNDIQLQLNNKVINE